MSKKHINKRQFIGDKLYKLANTNVNLYKKPKLVLLIVLLLVLVEIASYGAKKGNFADFKKIAETFFETPKFSPKSAVVAASIIPAATSSPSPSPSTTVLEQPTALVPTPTAPTQLCLLSGFSYTLQPPVCSAMSQSIVETKKKDTASTQKAIDDIAGQLKGYTDKMDELGKERDSKCTTKNMAAAFDSTGTSPAPAVDPSIITQALASCFDGYNRSIQNLLDYSRPMADQISWLKDYQNRIQSGSSQGACSSHGGINPAAGRTYIGQVICYDGWQNSQVHYLNAKECIDYILSKLSI